VGYTSVLSNSNSVTLETVGVYNSAIDDDDHDDVDDGGDGISDERIDLLGLFLSE